MPKSQYGVSRKVDIWGRPFWMVQVIRIELNCFMKQQQLMICLHFYYPQLPKIRSKIQFSQMCLHLSGWTIAEINMKRKGFSGKWKINKPLRTIFHTISVAALIWWLTRSFVCIDAAKAESSRFKVGQKCFSVFQRFLFFSARSAAATPKILSNRFSWSLTLEGIPGSRWMILDSGREEEELTTSSIIDDSPNSFWATALIVPAA